jgi:glycosyltransferase involved in cell wall biosynthesis
VQAQDFTDFRVVISDNASPPAIAADIAAYVASLDDPRIRFVAQAVNGGEYGQGRYLFAEAERDGAEFFMILHDDDTIVQGYLARAVAALDAAAAADLFIANPRLVDRAGQDSPAKTRAYLAEHGRNRHPGGLFDVLDQHMASGFTPISATVFRTAAIAAAGLTDADCFGNYPFECNVMLRLGDAGAKGWFCPDQLLSLRYHEESLRVYSRMMDNQALVSTMLRLFERRRYSGANERRRRVLVSRLRRADALLRLRQGDLAECRRALAAACAANPLSPKAWGCRLAAWLTPERLRAALPEAGYRMAPIDPRLAAA